MTTTTMNNRTVNKKKRRQYFSTTTTRKPLEFDINISYGGRCIAIHGLQERHNTHTNIYQTYWGFWMHPKARFWRVWSGTILCSLIESPANFPSVFFSCMFRCTMSTTYNIWKYVNEYIFVIEICHKVIYEEWISSKLLKSSNARQTSNNVFGG